MMAVYTPRKTKHIQKRAPKPKQDKQMSALISAANSKSESAFVLAYHTIDWQTIAAEDFVQAIHLALAAGAYLVAQKLAKLGAERYPQDPDLKKFVYVLAPPKTVRRTPAEPSVKANHHWLIKNREAYRGKWVALENGNLRAVADSFSPLKNKLADSKGVLLTKVF